MRAAAAIALTVSACLCVACATRPEITFDEGEDFTRYRSWDWLPGAAWRIDVPSAHHAGLGQDLARLVARELDRRGFERARGGADLRIGALLSVRREVVTILETGAMEHVSSLHESPNYQVQAMVERQEIRERSRLVVVAVDARRRTVVWKGALEERFRGQLPAHLERTVIELLGHFPPAGLAEPGPDSEGGPSEFSASPSRSQPDV